MHRKIMSTLKSLNKNKDASGGIGYGETGTMICMVTHILIKSFILIKD